jgi:hypothetical protein
LRCAVETCIRQTPDPFGAIPQHAQVRHVGQMQTSGDTEGESRAQKRALLRRVFLSGSLSMFYKPARHAS